MSGERPAAGGERAAPGAAGRPPGAAEPWRGGKKQKPGKQPGAYLAWNDNPDKTVPHFPQVPCACGKDFPGPTTWACGTADVLRFLSDIAIPATINQAERHARPAKTQQEISGRKPWIPPVLDGATGSFL